MGVLPCMQVEGTKKPSMQCQLCSTVRDIQAGNSSLTQQFHSGWRYRSEFQVAEEMRELTSKLKDVLEMPWP